MGLDDAEWVSRPNHDRSQACTKVSARRTAAHAIVDAASMGYDVPLPVATAKACTIVTSHWKKLRKMFDSQSSMTIWRLSRLMGAPPVVISNVIQVIDMQVCCLFPYCSVDIVYDS